MNLYTERYIYSKMNPVRILETTESTNADAKQWAQEGAPHGALILAHNQTAGRGRRGRSFASPPGGLYMSVVLHPLENTVEDTMLITAAAAVAVCLEISLRCGLELSVKWVNDLFYTGKKCCGILAEGVLGPTGFSHIVVGIGLNYTTSLDRLSPELRGIATSLFPGRIPPVPPEILATGIRDRLLDFYSHLTQRAYLAEYRRRNFVLGQSVTVLEGTSSYPALAVAIDDNARLVVQTGSEKKILSAGEIRIRPSEYL